MKTLENLLSDIVSAGGGCGMLHPQPSVTSPVALYRMISVGMCPRVLPCRNQVKNALSSISAPHKTCGALAKENTYVGKFTPLSVTSLSRRGCTPSR